MTELFIVHKDQDFIATIKPNTGPHITHKWYYAIHKDPQRYTHTTPLATGTALTHEDAMDMVDLFLSEQKDKQ
jgi:hypothetical protein